ncbi:restriction endonuclease subunit S [Virgibacillus dokdonensis]|uniref:Restriction endonuclease subunit S n=1 Tax=Virgibacillus dokdonensis TaxID=302167 RepID=A0ABU7VJE0_9BACI
MEQKKRVPKRRFKGFVDEWEERILEDLGRFGKTYSYSRAKEGVGDYYHIHYGDIHKRYDGVIKKTTKIPSLKVEGNYETLNNGDIVLADASEDYMDLGKTVVIEEANKRKIIAGLHTFKFTPNEYLNSLFYLYYSQSSLFKKFSYKTGTGISVFGISKENINKMKLKIPSYLEQQKIGDFFKKLDDMITIQQRKLEKTKALKSAYLAEMFPAEGERVPKRRFAGFTDEWEERKLENVTDVRDGTHDSPKFYSEGHPFITSKNIRDGFITYEDIKYIAENDFEKINRRSKVDKDDILMGMIGTIGNIALVRTPPKFAIKNVALIKDAKYIYHLYLYYYLQSPNVMNQLMDGIDGGTQKFIALNKIRNLKIAFPNMEEQYKIGELMENLEYIIINHQRKLEKLQALKQAYLHEMFV